MSVQQDSITTRNLFASTHISNQFNDPKQDAFIFLSTLFNLQKKPSHLSTHTGCWDEYDFDINLRINFSISALQHISNHTRKQMLIDGHYSTHQGYFYMCMFGYSQMHLFGDELLNTIYLPVIQQNMNDLDEIDIDYEYFNHVARMLGPIVLTANAFVLSTPSVIMGIISRKILSASIHSAQQHISSKLNPSLSKNSNYTQLEKRACRQSIKIINVFTPLSLTCINLTTLKPNTKKFKKAKRAVSFAAVNVLTFINNIKGGNDFNDKSLIFQDIIGYLKAMIK